MYSDVIGSIVRSKAGRDKGRTFVVMAPEGDQFVYLADGQRRKLERPKKKKLKHLAFEQSRLDLSRLPEDGGQADAFIRKALNDLGYNIKTASEEG